MGNEKYKIEIDLHKCCYSINNYYGVIEIKKQWWTKHDIIYLYYGTIGDSSRMEEAIYKKLCNEIKKEYKLKYNRSLRIYRVFSLVNKNGEIVK